MYSFDCTGSWRNMWDPSPNWDWTRSPVLGVLHWATGPPGYSRNLLFSGGQWGPLSQAGRRRSWRCCCHVRPSCSDPSSGPHRSQEGPGSSMVHKVPTVGGGKWMLGMCEEGCWCRAWATQHVPGLLGHTLSLGSSGASSILCWYGGTEAQQEAARRTLGMSTVWRLHRVTCLSKDKWTDKKDRRAA